MFFGCELAFAVVSDSKSIAVLGQEKSVVVAAIDALYLLKRWGVGHFDRMVHNISSGYAELSFAIATEDVKLTRHGEDRKLQDVMEEGFVHLAAGNFLRSTWWQTYIHTTQKILQYRMSMIPTRNEQ
jgi:hypothetical protein